MKVVEEKNDEINKLKLANEDQTIVSQRNDILQKEALVLKVAVQQKEMDIKSLNELIQNQESIISKNDSAIEQYISEVNELKKTLNEDKTKESKSSENFELLESLKEKLENEQKAHTKVQDELSSLRIELESFKKDNPTTNESKGSLLKSYEEEIVKLKQEIAQEKQVIAHVQVSQEKEIMEKEKEIFILNKILTEERKVLLEKEQEIDKLSGSELSKFANGHVENVRNIECIKSSRVAFITQSMSEDSETITFHDALSEDEDVMIEDLEFDMEPVRKTYVDNEDLSLG